MHVGVVAQQGDERAVGLAADIAAALDVPVSLDPETASSLGRAGVAPSAMADYGLVVSIGGDGTFLYTARRVGSAPLLGVNLGEVGFLNVVAPEAAVETVTETVEAIRAGEASYRELTRVETSGAGVELPAALNEVAVLGPQRGHGNGVDVEVRVDGETYSRTHADGVIVATPTGSSAYNLSEGGPLVHPDAAGLIVTEMCADGSMPPLVVAPDAAVRVAVSGAETAYAVADGRTRATVDPPAAVTVCASADPVRVTGPELDFFAALEKLK
ncbi:NAD(+)/NADH kinase [Halosegnis sp.]|uniref:NAD(+)/NADH kinase n=1 Tax=Halosegnis sp. TaxID=2864959 RepID=UPI0035D4DB6E